MESWEEILKQNFVLKKYHQRSQLSLNYTNGKREHWCRWCCDWPRLDTTKSSAALTLHWRLMRTVRVYIVTDRTYCLQHQQLCSLINNTATTHWDDIILVLDKFTWFSKNPDERKPSNQMRLIIISTADFNKLICQICLSD